MQVALLHHHDLYLRVGELADGLLLVGGEAPELHAAEVAQQELPGLVGDDLVVCVLPALLLQSVVVVQAGGVGLDPGHGLVDVGVVDPRDEGQAVVVELGQPLAGDQEDGHLGLAEVVLLLAQQQQFLELLPQQGLHLGRMGQRPGHLDPVVGQLPVLGLAG